MPRRTSASTWKNWKRRWRPSWKRAASPPLALVSTGENLREWIYYTQSGEEFFNRLNTALAPRPKFPIEIRSAADPAWATYAGFMAALPPTT